VTERAGPPRVPRAPRLRATRRGGSRVTALELFFDLVFVLAVTQCTALISHDPSWTGVVEGLAVLALLWWAWGGYAWLTSLIDPEEGPVRLLMFGAMAAALVTSLCVPEVFGDLGLAFAGAYGVLRVAHLGLYRIGARDEPLLRRSIAGLAVGTAIGLALLVAAALVDGWPKGVLWALALLIDIGGPFVAGVEGWVLVAEHFAERYADFIIIALGESVVAIGVGAGLDVTIGVVVTAVLGMAVAAALWWTYFDVVAIVAADRLAATPPGRRQNALARDAWSYLHYPMVAGIVLVAFGLKTTLGGVTDELGTVPATALLGGAALYLLAHVAFRLRVVGTLSRQRLVVAVLLVALLPVGSRVPAVAATALVAALTWGLVAYEAWRFADVRDRVRHGERA
jgi:low temperature requirement protein LtrA